MVKTEASEETIACSEDGTSDVPSFSGRKEEPLESFDNPKQAPQAGPVFLTWPDQSCDEPAEQRDDLEDVGDASCPDDGEASAVNGPSSLPLPTGDEIPPITFGPRKFRRPRNDTSLVLLTRRFLAMLQQSEDGVLDLNYVSQELSSSKRRLYDVTNVLEGIKLIKKKYKNHIQWLGGWLNKDAIQMINNLAEEEKKLDELIKRGTGEVHRICVDEQTSRFAYVTYEDIQTIPRMREQTVLVVKGPEDTTLSVPHPKESLQVHLKSTQGPIDVLICSDEPLPMEVTDGDVSGGANSSHVAATATSDSLHTSLIQMPLKSEPCF
ncbi:transcription factor E2F3 isoform X1 [Phyllopteryx taeniolatus]|uniref:transcription factor E2F3 isoform X1 n=1 Tax=Phyllopteryx taeniolatus TaxID=161469 RepID=UPI002AD35BC5|nr:transcription factor E2F3 isoform X1 [Phyllopteryx taeniolatus]